MTNKNDPENEEPEYFRVGDRVTVRRRGKKGIYIAEFSDNGVHRRVSLKTYNAKIARQRALTLEMALTAGDYQPKPKRLAITVAVAEFLALKRAENKRPKTLIKYESTLGLFRDFCAEHHAQTLDQITPRLFDAFRGRRREDHHAKTVYTELIVVKGLVNWCVSRGLLASDPLRGCRLEKPPMLPRMAPSLEQVNTLLEHAHGWQRIAIALLAFTGMRAGELQMLRREDVDLDGGWIHIVARADWAPKNKRSRKIPIHQRLCNLLMELPRSRGVYFFCADASPKYPAGDHHISIKHLNESIQRLARRVGIKTGRKEDGIVQHSLRHFFETHSVNAGIPQRVIDIWMGHTGDRSMASVYYRLSDKEAQKFIANVPF